MLSSVYRLGYELGEAGFQTR